MPETPIALRVPQECPQCDALGRVRFYAHLIMSSRIALGWYCDACHSEWPVRRKDLQNPPSVSSSRSA